MFWFVLDQTKVRYTDYIIPCPIFGLYILGVFFMVMYTFPVLRTDGGLFLTVFGSFPLAPSAVGDLLRINPIG